MNKNLLNKYLLFFFFTWFVVFKGEAKDVIVQSSKAANLDSCSTDHLLDSLIFSYLDNNKLISKYYPNPARDFITFEFSKKIENNCRLFIYSFTGRKMSEIQISNLKVTVNLGEYFRGIYMFQLISPKGQVMESGKFQVLK